MEDHFNRDTNFEMKTECSLDKNDSSENGLNEDSCESRSFEENEVINNFQVKVFDQRDHMAIETGQNMKELSPFVKKEVRSDSDNDLKLKFEDISDGDSVDGEMSNSDFASQEDLTRQRIQPANIRNIFLHKRLDCPVCNYKAPCTCNYQRHVMFHTDPLDSTKFKCFFCNHRTKNLQLLRVHMLVHKDYSEDLKCFICKVICKSKMDFNNHMELHKDHSEQNKLECVYCDHKTTNVNNLRMHLLIHKNSVAVQECCLCQHKSKNKSDLLRHFHTHKDSSDLNLFKCGFCDHKTMHLGNLRFHLSTHRDAMEVLRCCVCDSKCDTKEELAIHFLIHRDSSSSDSFECSFCNYSTSYLADSRSHVLKHNRSLNDNSKFCMCQYSCLICDFKTKYEQEFEIHLKESHGDCDYVETYLENLKMDLKERLIFRCDSCKFKTLYRSCWKSHMKSKHLERAGSEHELVRPSVKRESVMYKCKRCSYRTKSFFKFRGHQKTHKDPSERQQYECITKDSSNELQHSDPGNPPIFRCGECSFTTFYKYMLKRHKETHKDRSERQLYECATCFSRYTTKNALKEHILLQHSDPDSRPKFRCHECKFTTFYKSHLKMHRVKKHLEKAPEPKARTTEYKCDICSYRTMKRAYIKKHNETHKDRSERQLYECSICISTYTTKNALKEHSLRQHSDPGDQPKFQCRECTFTTFYKSSFKLHTKRNHLEPTPEPNTQGKIIE